MTMVEAGRRASPRQEGSEESLARRIHRRDESALREIVADHGGRVFRAAIRTLRDRARAEEVVQDTFLALWTDPDAFDAAKGSLRSFLLGIAHHKAVDAIRKQTARDRALGRLVQIDHPMQHAGTGSTDEAAADLIPALKTLSPHQRETMFWAFYVGLTYREVAIQMGIPEGTAKSRIRDALHHLRNELSLVEVPAS